ncbi:acyltransferase [Symbioplanes lichenis]|uniref:acyltransferase n=1 Tax=Symbioplanes lichenis TaxID=1629072 RepID=UPI002739B98F|nr:acyltransferase [Actinoplanes lichenis]
MPTVTTVTTLADYSDERGNKIIHGNTTTNNVKINFRGTGNTLVVSPNASIGKLEVHFDCNNAVLEIGGHSKVPSFRGWIRLGEDAKVRIGANVSMTNTCTISAVEGATITIGNDVMIASDNDIRADDAHPIFDVTTGERINPAQDITIGNHVWIAKRAVVLGGASIGDGSILGFGSLLTGKVPNNCVAAGTPARVIRENVAWERPHLSLTEPYYKPDASTVTKTGYWNLTQH